MMVCNNFFAEENKRILICRVQFGALKILDVNSILRSTNMIFQASEDSFRFAFKFRRNSIATRWPRVASSFTLDLFRGRKLASGSIVLLEFPAFQFVFQTWAKSHAGN